MTEQPINNMKLAQAKRDLARRARRLAQLQREPDSARLTQFAADLDQEADALEQSAATSLPLAAAPVHQQQVQQQQQSSETPTQPELLKRKN